MSDWRDKCDLDVLRASVADIAHAICDLQMGSMRVNAIAANYATCEIALTRLSDAVPMVIQELTAYRGSRTWIPIAEFDGKDGAYWITESGSPYLGHYDAALGSWWFGEEEAYPSHFMTIAPLTGDNT